MKQYERINGIHALWLENFNGQWIILLIFFMTIMFHRILLIINISDFLN